MVHQWSSYVARHLATSHHVPELFVVLHNKPEQPKVKVVVFINYVSMNEAATEVYIMVGVQSIYFV